MNNSSSIPDKKYFSISEVSDLCKVKPHTLRFWEKEFNLLKPSTRKGSRRVYQKEDILLVQKIRFLLYEEGLTISGARKKLTLKDSSNESSIADYLIDDLQEILKEIKRVV